MAGADGILNGERVRVDMHVHTRASFDCLTDPEEVLRAAARRGIARVCITDHDEIHAARALKERHPDRVIVGEEVKTAEGVDVIGLFLVEGIPGGTPARETCERIREQGGLVYVPHPFVGGKGGRGRILPGVEELVDVLEGFNARTHRWSVNDRAVAWAMDRGIALGAGSDAHTPGEVGRAWVEVDAFEDDAPSFLAALRSGRISGAFSPRSVHLASTWARIRKRLP